MVVAKNKLHYSRFQKDTFICVNESVLTFVSCIPSVVPQLLYNIFIKMIFIRDTILLLV